MIDKQTRLATAQALTASGATTDYYDASQLRNLGDGEPMAMVFTPTVDADYATTDETYAFAVQGDDNTSFSTPIKVIERLFSLANNNGAGTFLKTGMPVVIPIPPGLLERYIRGYVTLGGTTPSVTFHCDIVPLSMVRKSYHYPSNFSIS